VGNLFSGIVFLLSGALVYAHNTEMHDPAKEITFSRLFGMEAVGPTETVALLLGIGMFFLGLGAFRWITDQALLDEQDAESGPAEAGENEPKGAS
jgi:hypothetical protein